MAACGGRSESARGQVTSKTRPSSSRVDASRVTSSVERIGDEHSRSLVPSWLFVTLQFCLAVVAAAAVTFLIRRSIAGLPLDVETDIIGYPVFSNFNIKALYNSYWLVVAVFPMLTLGFYLLLARLSRRYRVAGSENRVGVPWDSLNETGIESANQSGAAGLGRTVLVGGVFGIIVSIVFADSGVSAVLALLFTLIGYVVVNRLIANRSSNISRSSNWTVLSRSALVNSAATILVPIGLLAVSATTRVVIASSGESVTYSWIPVWLSIVAFVAISVWIAWSVVQRHSEEDLLLLERRAVVYVFGAVGVFLLTSTMIDSLGIVDFFHEGEQAGGAQILLQGGFPWRDWYAIHGVFTDGLIPAVGLTLIDGSRWGVDAGKQLIIFPLYWVGLYYLCAHLFRRNWMFFLASQLIIVSGSFVLWSANSRLLFVPFILLLFVAFLKRSGWGWAAGLIVLLFVQAVVSPETAYLVPAVLVTIVACDFYGRDRAIWRLSDFRRIIRVVVCGAAVSAIWVVFLASQGALEGFVGYFRTFARDHELTGGIPIQWDGAFFAVAVVLPIALSLIAFWYFAASIIRRREITVDDWVMGAYALFLLFYYVKGLSRADPHVFTPYATALPLLAYVIYKVSQYVDGIALRIWPTINRLTRHPMSFVFVVAVVAIFGSLFVDVVAQGSERIVGRAEQPVSNAKIGYVKPIADADEVPGRPGPDDLPLSQQSIIDDVGTVLDAYVGPDGKVFDFSNSPLLFSYMLERESGTRYYHVSMAIRSDTQADLLSGLELARPEIVVFSTQHGLGLPIWDGISNQVRHYRVSEYVLENYVPLVDVDGYVLYGRADLSLDPGLVESLPLHGWYSLQELYFDSLPCDWGFAPNFVDIAPEQLPGSDDIVELDIGDPGAVAGGSVVLPSDIDLADYAYLEVETTDGFVAASFVLGDDPVDLSHQISFKTLDGAPDPLLVNVGACQQWYGYGTSDEPVRLWTDRVQSISAVRLVR